MRVFGKRILTSIMSVVMAVGLCPMAASASAGDSKELAATGLASDGIASAATVADESETALGLFKYIRDNATAGSAEWVDAQCAIDILTGENSGTSYPTYQGATRDGYGASNNVQACVDLTDAGDAASLANFETSLGWIDVYNRYRSQENEAEGTSLQPVGMNCRLMAVAIVQLDWSRDYSRGGHSQAYSVAENLSWGSSNPFDGWYTSEKKDYKNGGSGVHGHYLNIVDMEEDGSPSDYPASATGFATVTSGATYGRAHGQAFYTFGKWYPVNVVYTTDEFRSRWLTPYEEKLPSITKTDLSGAKVTLKAASAVYNGKVQKGTVSSVTLKGKTIPVSGYKVTAKEGKDVGTYLVTIEGTGNYSGTATAEFKVLPASQVISPAKKTYSVKRSKTKNKKIAVKFAASGGGKTTWGSAKSGKVSIAKNGKVTVKKGAKKKLYTLKVKVTAAATANYAATTSVVKLKVRVK